MSLLCQIKSFLFEYYPFITRDDVYYALNIKIKLYNKRKNITSFFFVVMLLLNIG
jgi:hypothetical protein